MLCLSGFELYSRLVPLKFNVSHFTAQIRLLFVQKRKPKIFGFKNVMEKGIEKNCQFRKTLNGI